MLAVPSSRQYSTQLHPIRLQFCAKPTSLTEPQQQEQQQQLTGRLTLEQDVYITEDVPLRRFDICDRIKASVCATAAQVFSQKLEKEIPLRS